jgi:hypothetical protein
MTLPEARPGLSAENSPSLSAESLNQVVDILSAHADRLVSKYVQSGLPQPVAERSVSAELARLKTASGNTEYFTGSPVQTLLKNYIPINQWAELGCGAFAAHLPALNKNLQPKTYHGYELPQNVAAGNEAIRIYQETGLLPENADYQIHSSLAPKEPAQLSTSSLAAMYFPPEAMVRWVRESTAEGGVSVINDWIHQPSEIDTVNVRPGTKIQLTTGDGQPTGLYWEIGEHIKDTAVGRRFNARVIFTDPTGMITDISRPDDRHNCIVTLYTEKGRNFAVGWGLYPKDGASDEQAEQIRIIQRTQQEIWAKHELDSQSYHWDGCTGAAAPVTLAREYGYFSAIRHNSGRIVPPPLVPVMVGWSGKLDLLANAGRLTYIQQDGANNYRDFLTKTVSGANGLLPFIGVDAPIAYTAYITRNPDIIQRLAR